MLLLVDPQAVRLLRRVFSMGGAMDYPPDRPAGECNVILDPVAAGIVFQRLDRQLTLVPIEPTRGKPLEAPQLARLFEDATLDAVREACWGWKQTRGEDRVGLADPLTVAAAFEPDLVATERGRIRLRLCRHALPDGAPFEDDTVVGVTAFERNPEGPHRLVRSSRIEKTHEHVLNVISG